MIHAAIETPHRINQDVRRPFERSCYYRWGVWPTHPGLGIKVIVEFGEDQQVGAVCTAFLTRRVPRGEAPYGYGLPKPNASSHALAGPT